MQAQALRQQTAISPQQSLAVIKTLLSASFGCIAYLRNLLPDDNFGEGRLTSGERGSMSYAASSQESLLERNQRHVSGVTIKTVTRGFSTEADKLLNYLEHGIFHAIERQYLKKFIFAIYLDNDDPNNIVEAYTYTLTYYTVPGTTTTVPIMSLDDQLNSLSLNGRSKAVDAVAQATLKGRAPTLGDVKQSVKALIKNLILATQSLEPLPKRRFATFKLFYRENTPPEYEPPYFRPGDPEKDKFIFTTHNKHEAPEKFSVGAVVTPHHGIDVQIQSVVKYIPNDENNDSQFLGIEPVSKDRHCGLPNVGDSRSRSKRLETQRKDAEERVVAWRVEDPRCTDADAEGEDDPEFINDSGVGLDAPLGVRKEDGSIFPIEGQEDHAVETEEVDTQFFGKPEFAPSRVGQLQVESVPGGPESTQQLEPTQVISSTNETVNGNATDVGIAQTEPINGSVLSRGVDTQMLKAVLNQSAMEWSADNEMLDMETQTANVPFHDSIESYARDTVNGQLSKAPSSPALNTQSNAVVGDGATCACHLDDGDDLVFCDGCQKWFHLWCMGYHSPEDSRLPSSYFCIPCRLQGDTNFHLIKDAYPDILAAFTDTALFRRAIKLAEEYSPESLKEFRKVVKCEASLAEQLWKRLEREGFITLEVIESDKVGLMETRTRVTRTAAKKKVKSAKQVHKYVFSQASKKTVAYKEYFSPDSDAEKKLLGLKNVGRKGKRRTNRSDERRGVDNTQLVTPIMERRGAANRNPDFTEDTQDVRLDEDSQTQDDTQFAAAPTSDLKRPTGSSQETARASKKVKISITDGVDIEE